MDDHTLEGLVLYTFVFMRHGHIQTIKGRLLRRNLATGELLVETASGLRVTLPNGTRRHTA